MPQYFISVSRKPTYAFAELQVSEEATQWWTRSTLIESGESAGEVDIVLTVVESSVNAASVFLPQRYTVIFRDGCRAH
jgi:hypothetical protein